jgi:hypothetical protein
MGVMGLGTPYGHGREFQDFIDISTPAANTNASFAVPGDVYVRVIAARATLTTDANAANRFLALDFIGARGKTVVRNGAGLVVVANTTALAFVWNAAYSSSVFATNTPVFVPVLPLFLEPGMSVQFTVDNKQAGDQLSLLSLVVEKWPTGLRGELVGTVRE